ncbi:MAG: deoxyguanosinetriphosphate triphosphohydrolase [Ardenticatenaceae bacterium]|nr:deoxyguanosinetriphosphate triphosphohydrolase [Ardenticatenaceae bacterium]MCB8947619.1 deoxyguanosinetriphosphate triphosphohydrolase [Ardenticatenaceae bacterium]
MIYKREELEKIEQLSLAPYGLKSANSKGRVYPEAESKSRPAFERDRDRIIHTTAFRRLEYKTQVFVYYEGDHYRTRLTHTLEVAQLGRSLARGLGCNEELTEAICLAHDLGHPPFGHAGEYALNALMADYGGFNHNTQSYRIVTQLEQPYRNFPGLNLTYETREGMIKHETDYDKSDAEGYEPDKRGSLEAQIANLADEIAYNAHDLDDGLRAGMFEMAALDELTLWQELQDIVGWHSERPLSHITRHEIIRELIGKSVMDVLEYTGKRLVENDIDSPEKVQTHSENLVSYSPEFRAKVRQLKKFLLDSMYRHYRLIRMQTKAERFVTELFQAYANEPNMLPTDTKKRLDEAPLHRVITDYIAGMTDRYALDEWEKLYNPYRRA